MLRIVEKLIPISMIVILTSCGNLDTLTDADDVEAEAVQVEEVEAETEAGTEAPGDGAQPITSSIALYAPVDGANDVSPTIDIFVTFSEAFR